MVGEGGGGLVEELLGENCLRKNRTWKELFGKKTYVGRIVVWGRIFWEELTIYCPQII
jgi:hypothetical protein